MQTRWERRRLRDQQRAQVHEATRWGLPAPPLGTTSLGSPPITWITNYHHPTWTREVKDPPLEHPGSEARSWETTIFEGVGTSSRRLESGAGSGVRLRSGTLPTNFQRSISLIEGDRGQNMRRLTSEAGFRKTLRLGSHPATCQRLIAVIQGDGRKNPRRHKSEARFRDKAFWKSFHYLPRLSYQSPTKQVVHQTKWDAEKGKSPHFEEASSRRSSLRPWTVLLQHLVKRWIFRTPRRQMPTKTSWTSRYAYIR